MKFLKFIILIVILLPAGFVKAQEKLSLEDAISMALKNNYDIRLSKNLSQVSLNNLQYGKTAFLPAVTGNLSNVNQIQTSEVDLASGETRRAENAKSSNLNYGVSVNWLVFDGFQLFTNYKKLEELEKIGELNAKITIENTIADVIAVYFDLVAQKQQLKATQTALEVSLVRLKNARSRYQIGKGSKLEFLAAQVDLNTDTTQLLRQEDLLSAAKVRLNQLLARDPDISFMVSDTITIDQGLQLASLKNKAETQNFDLQTAVINEKLAELDLKQIKGQRYPYITLTSGYNFAKNTSPPTSFSLRSNTHGLNYGVTASINIFNGFLQNRNEKNAKIGIENARLSTQKTKEAVQAQLITSYQNYQTNLKLVTLEASNLAVAKENLNITLEKYRLGSIVPLELREAQRNFIDATARYANSQYEAKLAEIALKEITGSIGL